MSTRFLSLLGIIILVTIPSCKNTFSPMHNVLQSSVKTAYEEPPLWAQKAIWYQIFVERFRNGNAQNNPTLETCAGALTDSMPFSWQITPWGHSWYVQEDYAKETGLDFYRTIQMRRYGGDLAGVLQKVSYLKDLGVTAVYFNPLNDAPSLHKYDARHYHHIDITFGEDPSIDKAIMATEDPSIPATWQWTTADSMFLKVIDAFHKEGIKVVLDFSWNHTGSTFWAFKDVIANGEKSSYKNWYHTEFKTDEITGKQKVSYEGWYGISTLPEIRKISGQGKTSGEPYEGDIDPKAKEHIFAVAKRWIDPKGDGSCIGGIDGMRLDVAEHVPVGFWRDFRRFVRHLNPDFYLVGENWWKEWPDVLMDPSPWVQGDIFDAVMHYQWFKIARGYFAQSEDKLTLEAFKLQIDSLYSKYKPSTQRAMMNLAASHDSPRLLTSFFNGNKYKFRCKPQEDSHYRTDTPDELTYNKTMLFLLHQFTFVGSPHIWNGDEMGMVGADDPDNRKPLLWDDIEFDMETSSEFSDYSYSFRPKANAEYRDYIKSLIALRKKYNCLSMGDYSFVKCGSDNILAYQRSVESEKILVVFNNNDTTNNIIVPYYTEILWQHNIKVEALAGKEIQMTPYSGLVLKLN